MWEPAQRATEEEHIDSEQMGLKFLELLPALERWLLPSTRRFVQAQQLSDSHPCCRHVTNRNS